MFKKILFLLLLFLVLTLFPLHSEAAPITSPFGWRVHPITGIWSFHRGLDIGYDTGEAITAMMPGTVVYCAWWDGYGNCIILEHSGGDHTLYAHCDSLLTDYGSYVEQGQIIATVGSTGNTTGPHLHLEYWHNGQYFDPIILWR